MLKNKYGRALKTIIFRARKHSPEILLIAGAATGVYAIYSWVKATRKYDLEVEPDYIREKEEAERALYRENEVDSEDSKERRK